MPLPVWACSPTTLAARLGGAGGEFLDLQGRHAEFRLRSGGMDVLVVAASLPRVQAHEDLPALEEFRPGLQRIQVVQSDVSRPWTDLPRTRFSARNSA